MLKISLTEDQVRRLIWSLQVASNAVSVQSGYAILPDEAMQLVAHLDVLEEKLETDLATYRSPNTPEDQGSKRSDPLPEQLRLLQD